MTFQTETGTVEIKYLDSTFKEVQLIIRTRGQSFAAETARLTLFDAEIIGYALMKYGKGDKQ